MPAKLKVIPLALFWLVISALLIVAFAGIISPHPMVNRHARVELTQKVIGTINKEHIAVLETDTSGNDLQASLSFDTSNRNAIITELQLPGNLENIFIDKDRELAFLANSFSGLTIFDISDPENLQVVGSLQTPGKAWDIEVRGDILYLASTTGGLHLIDISSPELPRIVSELHVDNSPILGLIVADQTVYAKAGKKGLLVIDISNINAPQLVSRHYENEGAWGLLTHNDMLFVSCGESKLEVLDISVPASPQKIGETFVNGNAWDLAYRENILYMPTVRAGLIIVDVSKPKTPRRLKHSLALSPLDSIDLQHNRAYISSRTGSLSILDISSLTNPVLVGTFNLPSRPRNIIVRGQIAYSAAGREGLQLIDLEKLSSTDRVATNTIPGTLLNFARDDKFYYITTSTQDLFVFTYNSKGRPEELVAQKTIGLSARYLVRNNHYLYLSSTHSGLMTVDVSDPATPQIVNINNQAQHIRGFTVAGSNLYLIDAKKGVLTYDIESPEKPILVGTFPLTGVKQLAHDTEHLYVSTESSLYIFDYESPLAIKQLGKVDFPWPLNTFASIKKIAVKNGYAYLAAGPAGLFSINMTDPGSPQLEKITTLGGDINTVAVDHMYIYALTRQGKLWLLQRSHNNEIMRLSVLASLGIGTHLIPDDDHIIISSGIKGLTFLQRPQQLTANWGKRTGRNNNVYQLSVQIPPQTKPGIYNINIINDGELTEFIGAVELKDTLH